MFNIEENKTNNIKVNKDLKGTRAFKCEFLLCQLLGYMNRPVFFKGKGPVK